MDEFMARRRGGALCRRGACWLPVVWLQLEMAKMARVAHAAGSTALPDRYWRFSMRWEWLGYPAFPAMIAVYFLMVFKPA